MSSLRAIGGGPAARTSPRGWLGPAVAMVAIVVLAFAPGFGISRLTLNLGADVLLIGVACAGVNLLLGYGGMLSLGSALYLGTGAYSVALATTLWHWPMLGAMVAGIAVTLVIAAVLGVVLVRLSEHYFAVATLGLATAFAGLIVAYPNTTGGTSGLTTLRELNLGFTTVNTNLGWYVVALVAAAIALAVFRWSVAGRRGRILKLVRQDELVASVLGIRTFQTRLALYTTSAFFPGLAGVLLFPFLGLITPDYVGSIESVQMVALVVIGGVGIAYGSLLGALVILWMQALVDTSGNYSLLIYGAVFLLCAFYLPGGIAGGLGRLWTGLIDRLSGSSSPLPAATSDSAVKPAQAVAGTLDPEPRVASPPSIPDADGSGGSVASASAPAGLEVRGASRSFGGVVAVHDVSLTLPRGAVTALIGSNGAGKSTLVNLISGVERLDAGSVRLGDEEITTRTAAQRTRLGIARTFQVPRLVEDLSVLDNVMIGREAAEASLWRRSARREREQRQAALRRLNDAGLGHLADRRVGSLGTGERKFVELVRALDEEPAVCLLDEPAVGLSLEEIDYLQSWIGRLRRAGTAVLVIDHNLDFVEQLADMVYVMDVGQIVRSGSPGELLGTREARASLLETGRNQR